MQREIKFRAYHIPTKKMFNVFSWCKDCFFEDSLDGVGTSPTLPAEAKDCILMQFTGLKDKKGVEIYEGDVYIMGDNNIKYLVVWHDSGFIGNQIGNSSYAGLEHWKDCISIIGNIHENPELIKK